MLLSGSLDEVPGGELIGVAEAALLWPSAG